MSVPPGNNPYSSSGYVPAPPRPAGGGKGWKIFGVGCLALFLLAAIGGIVLVRNVKSQLAHPDKSSVLGIGVLAGQAGADGLKLQQAIVAYHAEKGQYPRTLDDLVAENRIDGKLLHSALDDDPNPGHVSWRYTAPPEGAPGTTPILVQPYQVTINGQSAPGQIVITLDGKTLAGNKPPPSPGSP